MKIVNDKLLALYRGPGRCDLCKMSCREREVHHLMSKGAGGGSRMDIPINLCSVGVAFSPCVCHREFHAGSLPRREFIVAVANREFIDPDYVEETLLRLHNAVTDKLCECPETLAVRVGRELWCCSGCGKGRS